MPPFPGPSISCLSIVTALLAGQQPAPFTLAQHCKKHTADSELERLKEELGVLAAPEQFFGANRLSLRHAASGVELRFDALSALKGGPPWRQAGGSEGRAQWQAEAVWGYHGLSGSLQGRTAAQAGGEAGQHGRYDSLAAGRTGRRVVRGPQPPSTD